ncbi:site-2 protease family protein [Nakamurella sp.]|uniref:site-2 protease family protein n=1 Tax=Nakamurella sp. TaxID=1869182 RepID=UPI003782E069
MTSGRRSAPRFAPARGWPVGRIGGVRILITPSWIASIAVIAVLGVPVVRRVVPGTNPTVAVVVAVGLGVLLGVSVLAHELGHCLVAKWIGIEVVAVRLYLLGGVSELATGPVGARDEALVAAAGPAVSGVLAGAFWLALQPTTAGTVGWLILLLLALSNLVIAVFNLLPALPLDGGRVIRAGIWGVTGSRRAGTVAAVVGGYLLGAALVGWAVLLLVDDGAAALLPAGIAVAMALFVVAGLVGEHSSGAVDAHGHPGPADPVTWPVGISLQSLARPIVRLPTDTPVRDALAASVGAVVILAEADGMARGVLDADAARELAARDPLAPASVVARSIRPEAVVFDGDDPDDVLGRARRVVTDTFVLVDDSGVPVGAIRAVDVLAVPQQFGPQQFGQQEFGQQEFGRNDKA